MTPLPMGEGLSDAFAYTSPPPRGIGCICIHFPSPCGGGLGRGGIILFGSFIKKLRPFSNTRRIIPHRGRIRERVHNKTESQIPSP